MNKTTHKGCNSDRRDITKNTEGDGLCNIN